ncbi:MAG: hypothetical protein WC969_10425 [Elusimicrobiota bacterium]|jgi:hypothetical protein
MSHLMDRLFSLLLEHKSILFILAGLGFILPRVLSKRSPEAEPSHRAYAPALRISRWAGFLAASAQLIAALRFDGDTSRPGNAMMFFGMLFSVPIVGLLACGLLRLLSYFALRLYFQLSS